MPGLVVHTRQSRSDLRPTVEVRTANRLRRPSPPTPRVFGAELGTCRHLLTPPGVVLDHRLVRRAFTWVVLLGGTLVMLGVLWQAFTIAAYVRGAGDGALDAHLTGSFFVHAGQLGIVIGAIVAYWKNWTAVATAAGSSSCRSHSSSSWATQTSRAAGSTGCTASWR